MKTHLAKSNLTIVTYVIFLISSLCEWFNTGIRGYEGVEYSFNGWSDKISSTFLAMPFMPITISMIVTAAFVVHLCSLFFKLNTQMMTTSLFLLSIFGFLGMMTSTHASLPLYVAFIVSCAFFASTMKLEPGV